MKLQKVGRISLAHFALCALTGISFLDDLTAQELCIEGRVIDVHGAPIPDAFVVQKTSFGSEPTVPLEMLVRQDGTFRMLAPATETSDFGLYVIAPGYATKELRHDQLRGRTIDAVLKPEVKLNVRVVRPDGEPIPGAMVCGNWTELAMSRAIKEKLAQTSNEYGEAEIGGLTRGKHISVLAEVPGKGTFTWLFPNGNSDNRIWELVCPNHRTSLEVSVIDHVGVPVSKAYVSVNRPSEEVNTSVMQEPGLIFHSTKRTPGSGIVLFDTIVSEEVEVNLNVMGGSSRLVRLCKTPFGKKSSVVLQLPKVASVAISIVAPKELVDRSGIEIHFVSETGSHQFRAKTNEDGIVDVQLEPGLWSYYPIDNIPTGFAFCGQAPTVRVDNFLGIQNAMPIYLSKARLIEGKILGVDFAREPYNWMLVENKKDQDCEMQPAGRIDHHGYFRLWVAEEILDEDLFNFQTPVHERGTIMEVVSKSPWVLTPRKDGKAKD